MSGLQLGKSVELRGLQSSLFFCYFSSLMLWIGLARTVHFVGSVDAPSGLASICWYGRRVDCHRFGCLSAGCAAGAAAACCLFEREHSGVSLCQKTKRVMLLTSWRPPHVVLPGGGIKDTGGELLQEASCCKSVLAQTSPASVCDQPSRIDGFGSK